MTIVFCTNIVWFHFYFVFCNCKELLGKANICILQKL